MTTYRLVFVECEICGHEYAEYPLAMTPHVCEECGGDLEDWNSEDGLESEEEVLE